MNENRELILQILSERTQRMVFIQVKNGLVTTKLNLTLKMPIPKVSTLNLRS
jgi:hypothetical protein